MIQARLAPLCGVTDFIFREICFSQGCDQACTEMISAMGYICAPEQRATQELMVRGKNEKKLILQLFGKEPDIVAEAARRTEALDRYDGIDLNMGCPARKIASSGEGCGLMQTPGVAEEMMRKTVQAVSLPVTVKIRLGWDRDHMNAVEIAKRAEDAGVREITVHGRTREQQYSGEADWEEIQRVAESVRIPVIGNGDIFDANTAVRRASSRGISGIMIGRGAMGNPWIFREIRSIEAGMEPEPVTLEERFELIFAHYHRMLEWKPEHIAVREMRKYVGWYLRGLRGSSRVRTSVNTLETPEEVFRELRQFQQDLFDQGLVHK